MSRRILQKPAFLFMLLHTMRKPSWKKLLQNPLQSFSIGLPLKTLRSWAFPVTALIDDRKPYTGMPCKEAVLALDISCASLNFELEESFAATKEGKWLKSNAPLYGFILRYPRRKEHITGYPWEPWHIRFVGKTLSLYLSLTGLTLEEYHDMLPDSSQIR